MSGTDKSISTRKPRADAERNHLRLLETAKAAFAKKGASVSLDEIAREAGVGIGTLYRHFPTRDALVEAVYRNEMAQMIDSAKHLAKTQPPIEALRSWLLLFVDHMAAKQGMTEALNSIVGGTADLYAESGAQIKEVAALLIDRGVESGDIQLAMDPLDLLRALAGVANISANNDWQQSAKRLVDILIAGIQVPKRT